MKMSAIASLLKEAEDSKIQVPDDLPNVRAALENAPRSRLGNPTAIIDKQLEEFKRFVEEGELIKREYDDLKRLNTAFESAWENAVTNPMLAMGQDERDANPWWQDLYWLGAPAFHTAAGRVKKINAMIKKHGDNEYLQAGLKLAEEIAPLGAAYKELKSKIVKKKAAKIEAETKQKETKSRQMANHDVQRVRAVLTQITQQLRDKVIEGQKDVLYTMINRWAKQYDPNEHRATSNYNFNARNPFARDIVRKAQVHKSSYYDPEELKPQDEIDAVVEGEASKIADNMLSQFIEKNTTKLAEILNNKNNLQRVELVNAQTARGVVEGLMKLTFADGSSFNVNNKVVYSVSNQGKWFARFPTTFHNVLLPDGSRMKGTASEARMKEEFTND